MPDRPIGIPPRFDEHVKLLFDLQWLAYQSDLTRVFTLMYGREFNSRPYPGNRHQRTASRPLASRRRPGAAREICEGQRSTTSELFAYFLEKLRNTPDGDGTLLDNTILLYGGGFSNANVHRHVNLPLVVAGGGAGTLKGGRHLSYKASDDVPMTNLLISCSTSRASRWISSATAPGPLSGL